MTNQPHDQIIINENFHKVIGYVSIIINEFLIYITINEILLSAFIILILDKGNMEKNQLKLKS